MNKEQIDRNIEKVIDYMLFIAAIVIGIAVGMTI